MPYNPKLAGRGMSRRERALGHQKGAITTVGAGTPDIREGSEGDFSLRKTAQGLKLFIKSDNRWYDVNNLTAPKPFAWHDAVLVNSWARYSTDWYVPGYSKDSHGNVHLRGLLKSGSGTDVMFVLPAGFRPSIARTWCTSASSSGLCVIEITSAGNVFANSGGSGTWTNLNGLIFYAG